MEGLGDRSKKDNDLGGTNNCLKSVSKCDRNLIQNSDIISTKYQRIYSLA